MARSLVQRRTRVLGVLLSDLHNTFFADVLDGIAAQAAEHGYKAMLNTGNRAPSGAKSFTTGPGCGGYTSVGLYRDGRKGWVDHGDGKCGSTFVSIPMSGDARRDDSSAYGQWTFAATGSCDVSVFIPNGNLEEVGGNPTVYYVFDRNGVGGTPLASFAIKQVEKRGQWVNAGKFKASGNLTVQLLTRGQDWNNSGPTYAHHAASAVKADCTA